MKVYTKKGDKGSTSLIGGTRVLKSHIRIEAYGTIDELNSFVGLLKDQAVTEPFADFLKNIQDLLFTMGSHLAADPERSKMQLPEIQDDDVTTLEVSMDEMEETLPGLTNFVLPGGHPANSMAHICRTVCRRAERICVNLSNEATVNPLILVYLNRLSDWFFVFARWITHQTQSEEILWSPRTETKN